MNKLEIEATAKDYMRKLGYCENTVNKLRIEYRKKYRNSGMCYPSRKQIIFNSNLLDKDATWWNNMIAHEVAHFRARGHGKRFREVLASINQGALTTHSHRYWCSVESCIKAGIEQTFDEEIEQSDEEITGMKMEEVKARLKKMKGIEVIEV